MDIDLTDRASFVHFTPVTIRFSDQDSMGHINNVAIAQFIEAGRTQYVYDLIRATGCSEVEFILARVVIDYRAELHYPGSVEIGSRIFRVGNKSLTTGYGVFRGDTCYATSESVNVFYDMTTRKTMVPPEAFRTALEAERAEPAIVPTGL